MPAKSPGYLRPRHTRRPRRGGSDENSPKFNPVWHVIAPTPQFRPGSLVRKRGRIILHHFVGQMPLAGIAWQAVNYLLGLEKLGYEAWYVEDHGTNPYDPRISSVVMDCGYNVGYLRDVMERHGLAERWAYWDAINDVYYGQTRERVRGLYAKADPAARAYLGAHTHFFTYGTNLGTDRCRVPLCGVPWCATRPPIDLDLWPRAPG